jgi:hypothetical protein
VGSAFPAPSIAPTVNVCVPRRSLSYRTGEVHRLRGAPSREHSKDANSLAEKVNVADRDEIEPLGPESIVVSGGVASTVQERVAGVWSAFPSPSAARTRNVC